MPAILSVKVQKWLKRKKRYSKNPKNKKRTEEAPAEKARLLKLRN